MAKASAYKIVLVGDWFVGKEALQQRFTGDTMTMPLTNLALCFWSRTIELDGEEIKLHVWNIASQGRYHDHYPMDCRGASGIMLVYDITKEQTFENIPKWMKTLREKKSDVEIMLIGNKSDLTDERRVSTEQGEQLATDYGIKFMETSAKEKINVDKAFFTLARNIKLKKDIEPIQRRYPLCEIKRYLLGDGVLTVDFAQYPDITNYMTSQCLDTIKYMTHNALTS